MADTTLPIYPPSPEFAAAARVGSLEAYDLRYRRSLADPDGFWGELAEEFVWERRWDSVRDVSFERPVRVRWFVGGRTNLAVNCLDRHLPDRAEQPAFFWEGNDPGERETWTYGRLHAEVGRFANVLRGLGVKQGDRVGVYLQMVPQAVVACLACTRIGATHVVVFGALASDALRDRLDDARCSVLVTQDTAVRGHHRDLPMKADADRAVAQVPSIASVVVVRRTGAEVAMVPGRDVWYHDAVAATDPVCEPVWVPADHPSFVLHTSAASGRPTGIVHSTGGYMVHAATTFRTVFDHREGDVWWCAADIGWVTGHTYGMYGPLLAGATAVLFEGVPTYPDAGRLWDVIDRYRVTQLYTSPTAIRMLMRLAEPPRARHDLSSLRLLGTVGEPIQSEVWRWYRDEVGGGRVPVVDTWWQTETGGVMIAPLPGAHPLKPGSAGRPFFGVEPVILDDDGVHVAPGEAGKLCLRSVGPGMMQTVFGDHDRFYQTYFAPYRGVYFTGDGARRDADGDYWLLGRVDDVMTVSGHRLGSAEVESALVSHPAVAEAVVVAARHEVKGQAIYAYVVLRPGQDYRDELKAELGEHVRREIGPIARPDVIQWAPEGLPKSRSGKIVRRILRKIADDAADEVGATRTLADPGVVAHLVEGAKRLR